MLLGQNSSAECSVVGQTDCPKSQSLGLTILLDCKHSLSMRFSVLRSLTALHAITAAIPVMQAFHCLQIDASLEMCK